MKIKVVLLALLCALAAAAPAPAAKIRVNGSVEGGGKKIAGATLRLAALPESGEAFAMYWSPFVLAEAARTRSGPDGSFELEAPAPGYYQLQVTADGFLGSSSWHKVFFGDEVAIDSIVLLPARQVILSVGDPQGRPVTGARVRLWVDRIKLHAYDAWPLFAVTAADGSVVLQAPQAMDAAAIVWAEGYAATRVELPAGEERVAVRLDPGLPVEVEVVDTQRRPQSEVAVLAKGLEMVIGRTGSDGKVVVKAGPEQAELVFAATRGREAREALPAPGPQGDRRLRVELAEVKPLKGQVVGRPDFLPLAGAWVSMFDLPPVVTRTDRDGHFELLAEVGRYSHLQAVYPSYRPLSVEAGESGFPATLKLDALAAVEGRVEDADGKALAGALVSATVEGEESDDFDRAAFALADEQGRFRIEDAVAGEVLGVVAMVVDLLKPPGLQSPKVLVGPLQAGEKARIELQVSPPAGWTCRVVDPAGRPIAGAEVFAVEAGVEKHRRLELTDVVGWQEDGRPSPYGGIHRLGQSDAEGLFEAGGMNPGLYDLGFRARGFLPLLRRGVLFAPDAEEESGGATPEIVLQPLVEASGKVIGERGEGIAGATLHLDIAAQRWRENHRRSVNELPPVATSGEDGEFRFVAVDAVQRFDLLAVKEGYVTGRLADISLAEVGSTQEKVGLTLALIRGFRIEGRVSGKGEPLRGVRVSAEPVEQSEGEARYDDYYGRTDDQGRYIVDGIRPGRYRLEAGRLDGYQNWEGEPFEARGGEKEVIDIELEKAAAISGKVLLPNGEPVAEARVYLDETKEQPTWKSSDSTDELGYYRIETAKPGPGWLRVESRAHKTHWRAVDVAAGVNEVDIVLDKGSVELSGRVVDGAGEPVAGAEVQLHGEVVREARSGADGAVHFPDLEEGPYRLQIRAPGYFFLPQLIQLPPSLSGQVWRLAAAGGRIRGRIFGLDGAQLGGVRVRARPAADPADGPLGMFLAGGLSPLDRDESPHQSKVDLEGRYSIEGIPAGKWVLIADHQPSGRALMQEIDLQEPPASREQNLDFRQLGPAWVGNFRQAGESVPGLMYFLLHPSAGMLLGGQSSGGRLELRVQPGSYILVVAASEDVKKMLEIEIGAAASEETFDLDSP